MKVPIYQSQRPIPKGSGRQFSTAQISASALAAPAQAFAEAGEQLSQAGQKISAFAIKKAQIGADNEAAAASVELNVELLKLQSELLKNPNMENAEKAFSDRSRLLVDKFKAKLSNRLARDSFTARAREIEFNNKIKFTKTNNARVVKQRELLLDRDLSSSVDFVSDVKNSLSSRDAALGRALSLLGNSLGDFGPEIVEKKKTNFFERVAKTNLSLAMQSGANLADTVEEFLSGKIQDPILAKAHENLTQKQINKIAQETITETNRRNNLIDKEQKRFRELAQTNFDANLTGLVQKFNVEENMASEETASNFMRQTDEMMQSVLDSHQGTTESKAELSMQLQKLRTKHSLDFGKLHRKAQTQNAQRQIGSDLRALVVDTNANPNALAQSLQLLDQTISESGSNFMNTEQEELAREGGRQDLIEAALDGFLARGQIKEARELFSSPGIGVSLDSSASENYRRQFIKYDEDQNKSLADNQRKINNAEIILGRPLTMSEKAKILGVDIGTKGGAFKDESSLRKEFIKGSKDFVAVRDAFNKVQIAGQNVSAPGDLALIFNFMKMLDPGSVVRESEFNTAQFAASIPERFKASYNRVVKGTRLGSKARQEFVEEAARILEAQTKTQRGLEQQYTKLAETYGFNPANVVLSQIELGASQHQQPAPTPGAEPELTTTDGPPQPAAAPPPKKVFKLNALGK